MSWTDMRSALHPLCPRASYVLVAGIACCSWAGTRATAYYGCPENSHVESTEVVDGVTRVHCKCDAGFEKSGGKCLAGTDRTTSEAGTPVVQKQSILLDAKAVRSAVTRRDKPPFQAVWTYYEYNRPIAEGLAPNENRCAIVLSMTLGLEPRPGEVSLEQLGDKSLVAAIVGQIKSKLLLEPAPSPEVTSSQIARRYYIRAQDLAGRLSDEWGQPSKIDGPQARGAIAGKRGIVFLQHAYPRAGGAGQRTGDHIDVWNSDHVASSSTTPFEKAEKVWFWEIQ